MSGSRAPDAADADGQLEKDAPITGLPEPDRPRPPGRPDRGWIFDALGFVGDLITSRWP
jgi:hypothetical protein